MVISVLVEIVIFLNKYFKNSAVAGIRIQAIRIKPWYIERFNHKSKVGTVYS